MEKETEAIQPQDQQQDRQQDRRLGIRLRCINTENRDDLPLVVQKKRRSETTTSSVGPKPTLVHSLIDPSPIEIKALYKDLQVYRRIIHSKDYRQLEQLSGFPLRGQQWSDRCRSIQGSMERDKKANDTTLRKATRCQIIRKPGRYEYWDTQQKSRIAATEYEQRYRNNLPTTDWGVYFGKLQSHARWNNTELPTSSIPVAVSDDGQSHDK